MASRGNNSFSHHQQAGHGQHQHQEKQISFGMIQPSSSMHGNFNIRSKESGAYDLGELDQALFMYLEGQDHSSVQEQRQTLNIFPSQPMHVEPSTEVGMSLGSPASGGSKGTMSEPTMEIGTKRNNNNNNNAAVFDMEYGRWLEEHHRLMCELRAAVQEHLQENELRMFVDNCLHHYDEMFSLKTMAAKSDVFHLVSGMWKTPAERCFLWMGGFRPSELIKILLSHIEPLTEQQILGICALQQSTQETEDALSQGLESLYQSLSDTVVSDALSCPSNMANYMGQMAVAMNKLSTLEGFVRQADNLRQQTLHRLHQILTTRQSARCFLAIAEYFHRLRALSSLWMARPRQE
ncbi:uncharacterized protein A4U43_C05F12980 [Asparagus officinalis]|uniref:DOG1 domain-containing protein n=1 Tax=Asparagus officinalis TaxID=4686 RepID=A0A5P1ERA2_ASPOF|nr:uncharacterized protein A4U43_C05F12980 [Asparagus officinalis]